MSNTDDTYKTMGLGAKIRDTAFALAAAIKDVDDAERIVKFDPLVVANDILKARGLVVYRTPKRSGS